MRNLLKHWTDLLLGWLGVTSDTGGWDRWIAFLLVLLFVVLFDFACRLVIVRGVRRLVARTRAVWDDTLFMTVLVLANMGRILGRQDYTDEAVYQFLLHTKYLADKKTGLWYHGFTFHGNHNFAGAFWGRGNCWVTIAIPLLLEMLPIGQPARRILVNALENQIASLAKYQDGNGMWHTLIDDPTSYVEASATSGFGYGILKAVHMGLVDAAYAENAKKALAPILKCIREDGIVDQVSYGTAMGRETKDFYKQIPLRQMPYGQAMAMLFLMEAGEEA